MYLHRYIQLHWFTQEKLKDCINYAFIKGIFPDSFKIANNMPVYHKNEPTNEKTLDHLMYYFCCQSCPEGLCIFN